VLEQATKVHHVQLHDPVSPSVSTAVQLAAGLMCAISPIHIDDEYGCVIGARICSAGL
jgi:hypothetical protein